MLWGVCVGDTYYKVYGRYFSLHQINLVQDAGGNAFRLMLDKHPWDVNDTGNIYGISYRDYVKRIIEECHNAGIKVMVDLARWFGVTGTGEGKIPILRSDAKRRAWVDWGSDVINHVNPDSILFMDEPCSEGQMIEAGLTTEEYRGYVIEAIEQWRNTNPNIAIAVMGVPFKYLSMFHDEPLPYNKIVYLLNYPYYSGSYGGENDWRYRYWNAVTQDDLDLAKVFLHRRLDNKFGGLKGRNLICCTVGVGREAPYPNNWTHCMKATYEYCKANNVILYQYAFSKHYWNILSDDWMSFNEIGRFWAENTPTDGNGNGNGNGDDFDQIISLLLKSIAFASVAMLLLDKKKR